MPHLPPAVLSMLTAVMLLQSGNGLLAPLLPLRMQVEGLSATDVGMVATAYGLGFVAGGLATPRLVRGVGHRVAFAILAALAVPLAVGFAFAGPSVAAWVALRAVSGFAFVGLFTIGDSWISAQATTASRGTVFSVYMVANRLTLMLAPLGIGLGDVTGIGLFLAVGGMLAVSMVPLGLVRTGAPARPTVVALRPLELYRLAPSALVGSFGIGILNGSMVSLAPLYGVRVGLSVEAAAALLLALQGGSLLTQWPIGALSDRIDRRVVFAAVLSACALVSLAMTGVSDGGRPAVVFAGFAAWGGLSLSAYALCVAHASDVVPAERMVSTVGELLVAWAVGAIIGPLPAAFALEQGGPAGLFAFFAAVAVTLTGFCVVRILSRARRPRGAAPPAAADAVPVRLTAGAAAGGDGGAAD